LTVLTELTPEQDAGLDVVASEYLALLSRGDEVDLDAVRPAIEMIYGFYDLPLPEIEICGSPEAALRRAQALGVAAPHFDWCGASDAGWVAHYEVFVRLNVLYADESQDLRKMQSLIFGGVYDTVLLNERALLIPYPTECHLNARGDLHCATGPAISWRDGQAEYSWNGVWVSRAIIETPETLTRAQALDLSTEERRAFCERLGWPNALALFECQLVDSWSDPATGLSYELYSGLECGILRKQSPKLQDDSQPWYAEPVHRNLITAQAARKWQVLMRPGSDSDNVARTCNDDPELRYGTEA
jgi:hypothetical protein